MLLLLLGILYSKVKFEAGPMTVIKVAFINLHLYLHLHFFFHLYFLFYFFYILKVKSFVYLKNINSTGFHLPILKRGARDSNTASRATWLNSYGNKFRVPRS